jgi:hypothetical protein
MIPTPFLLYEAGMDQGKTWIVPGKDFISYRKLNSY